MWTLMMLAVRLPREKTTPRVNGEMAQLGVTRQRDMNKIVAALVSVMRCSE
jgi:hypothetical protein